MNKTIEEARRNLKEAVELYLEDEDAVIPSGDISLTLTSFEIIEDGKTSRALRT